MVKNDTEVLILYRILAFDCRGVVMENQKIEMLNCMSPACKNIEVYAVKYSRERRFVGSVKSFMQTRKIGGFIWLWNRLLETQNDSQITALHSS